MAQTFGEPVEKGPLAFENLRMSGGQIKPFGTVDFRKGLRFSTLGRPLDLEGVTFYGLNVEVAFDSGPHPKLELRHGRMFGLDLVTMSIIAG